MPVKPPLQRRTPPSRVGEPFAAIDPPAGVAVAPPDVRTARRGGPGPRGTPMVEPPIASPVAPRTAPAPIESYEHAGGLTAAQVVMLAAVTMTAFALRAFRADSILRSQDYAEIPFRVAHFWGWGWILESAYGPVQPLLTKLWALAVTSLGLPMTESLWRMPAIALGSLSPLLMYLLLRELGAATFAALAAANLLAVAPFAVSADRYPYSAETYGLCFALLTLWLAARHVRRPARGSGLLLGLSSGAYLLSHLLLHAFPVALAGVAAAAARASERGKRWRTVRQALLRPEVLLPPLAALGVMIAAYARTGGGQIGHLLFKNGSAETTLTGPVDWALHGLWLLRQFGWVGAGGVALAIPAAVAAVRRGRAAGAFLLWAVAFLLPVVLLHRYSGRMYGYYVQPSAALLAMACLAWRPLNRMIPRVSAFAGLGLVTIATMCGTVGTVFAGDRFAALTGVCCPIGAATPDPGYKAAGWYVRAFLPADWVIFTPHESDGLESMNAAYYLGRHCLAGENLSHSQMRRVFERFADRIDAAVVEPKFDEWFRGRSDWRCAAGVVRADGSRLRIYARPGRALPRLTLTPGADNVRFDYQFGPRAMATVLTPSPRLPRPSEIAAAAGRDNRAG